MKAAFAAFLFLSSCNSSEYYQISGETMGTSYHITYEGKKPESTKKRIDSLLVTVNNSLSTYIPTSTISKINSNSSQEVDAHFKAVFEKARSIYELTDGAFDPTIGPIVNSWGFGFENINHVDSNTIDSLMQYVGFDKVFLEENTLKKEAPEIMLDFSAIAKGYGVDQVALWLASQGVENYMVEIGGEVVVKGHASRKENWSLGINMPLEGSSNLFAIAHINDLALATSGNYRNFKIIDGRKYVHTIDPSTGYGAISSQLSSSVFAADCATADGLATAFMVLGTEKSIELSKKHQLEVYFIFLNEKNEMDFYRTESLKDKVKTAL